MWLLRNEDNAVSHIEELKAEKRVEKSLAEEGDTIWKQIIGKLEERLAELSK